LWTTDLPQRDIYELAIRYKGVPGPIKKVVNDTEPQWRVGDKATFWVHYHNPDRYGQVSATLRYITPHACAWVEDGQRVNDADLKGAIDLFETQSYRTNREFFGSEWAPGVDNDPHIHILNASIPGIGGYYSTSDEYPKIVDPYSNEHEMFYCNLGSSGPGEDYYNSTLAHEFQHMIHWYQDANEDGWVNEGFSELAAQLNGFDPGSLFSFLLAPDTQLNTWSDIEEAGAHYGGSYLFMAYFLDRFGEETTKSLVAEPKNGIAGINAVLADRGLTFDDLFADWVVANYLDDPNLADGRYGYRELETMRLSTDHHDSFPVRQTAEVSQYGTDYIQISGRGDVVISFAGATTVPVLGGGAHSGQYVWWGNRGDDSNPTMTREFDLSALNKATLDFWTWYDIETEWDYAYVSVSTDGGQTWTILRGPSSTDADPNGTGYGWGYTDKSGGGSEPRWIEESIDLTPYAGQPVLIRFEYITDDALNYPGILIDDVGIPELGYQSDFEADDDGWQANGFARIANILPQRYLVQVIEDSRSDVQIHRMELDEYQRGQVTVNLDGKEVILVVSGATPFTTEIAPYEYTIEPAR
ncbi:MAG: immune inhibitor A, partial [Chloroflexi bacterium]|nr:immune inhibitor A [Chloroflexota bacterium]